MEKYLCPCRPPIYNREEGGNTMGGPNILLSLVGNHDPFGDAEGGFGPVLSLLRERRFDQVYLLWTGPEYLERANMVKKEAEPFCPGTSFHFIPLEVKNVIDYVELFGKMEAAAESVRQRLNAHSARWSILLDPGTPQMQTCWFLLAKSGILPATLLQGIPPRFSGGIYKVREVEIENGLLPRVVLEEEETGSGKRTPIRVLQGEVESLSPGMRLLYEKARNAARYDVSVIIQGETGTGKEVLAQTIHRSSPRRDKPFLPVNCAAISRDLAESTLFGHVKGAFTGAGSDRPGYFMSAHGGTLFLDEIGELPLELQPKLLRALENGSFQPVGSDTTVRADIRLIAATNRSLADMVAEGTFREDLYQRLNVVLLTVIPLRERPEDIPLFFSRFLDEWNATYKETRRVGPETLKLLTGYSWPRNIRQLKAVVQQMCCLSLTEELSPDCLPVEILDFYHREPVHADIPSGIPDEGLNLRALLNHVEARYYRLAMERTGGNAEKAAGLLDIHPASFRKALRERIDIGQ